MTRLPQVDAAPGSDRAARRPRHRRGDRADVFHALRGRRARGAAGRAQVSAGLSGLRGGGLFDLRPAPQQMAVHFRPRPLRYLPRRHGARGVAARARLRPGRAQRLRHVLLRQDHHPAVLAAADVFPRRLAHRLSLFPLRAHAAARQNRRRDADFGARARRRRRSAAALDRKRRGQENLAGRHPVAVAGRPRPVDPRHPGRGRHRGPRTRGRRFRRPRHRGDAHHPDAVGALAGGAPGSAADPRAQTWPDDEPVAVARRRRAGRAARAGRGRGSFAAAKRQDRLPPPGVVRERQGGRRHRRRRLDRFGNLPAHGRLRRRPPAGDRKLRARAARGAGGAQGQTKQRGHSGPHRRHPRPRAHHEPDRAIQARHGVSRRRPQARAAARTGLGRGHQDKRIRLDQRRGCGGRRPAHPPWS